MITPAEAEQMYKYSEQHGFKFVFEAYPQYPEHKIRRAVSDHLDRVIHKHRTQSK